MRGFSLCYGLARAPTTGTPTAPDPVSAPTVRLSKAKNKPKPAPAEGQGGGTPARPALWLRLVLSVAVAWHVFVVFISPFAIPPASLLVSGIAYSTYVRWYSEPLYLNHGYHFFGPEPPVNQLIRYRVTDTAGATIAEGEFPNKEQQRPRLLYHRHMMLADQANLGPPDVPPEDWLRLSLEAYGRRLLRVHGGERVAVDCVRHFPLTPGQSLEGADPNAPELFQAVASIDVTAASLADPLPVPPPPAGPPPADAELLPVGGPL